MDHAQGRQSGSSFLAGTPGGGAGWASLGAAPASMGWGGVDTQKPTVRWYRFPTYN